MRKISCLTMLIALICVSSTAHTQIFDKLKNKAKDKVSERIDQKVDKAMDKGLDEAENAAKSDKDKSEEKTIEKPVQSVSKKAVIDSQPSFKVYSNYDFVPGDKILFEDHFTDDQDGEFATHWELKGGQAILNKFNGELALYLTDGNYARVIPRMKTEKYLSDPYTIEFDWHHLPGAYGLVIQMGFYDKEAGFDRVSEISVQQSEVSFSGTSSNVSLTKTYTEDLAGTIDNNWHHVALAFKNHQLKVYIDQYRVLVVPDTKEDYVNVCFAGIGDEKMPVIFKNLRIASGGNMNMIGKKFTESRIVTHGINFDIDKATIKPESMGTLNMIVQVMKDNPEIKFEIEGHTDNSGTAQHNLTLSQQRAEAVKTQLVKMGVDGSRLSTKGLGDTKPVSDNNTLEGKANNRRVEFVKK